ncbi:MAG TPA: hypothetical protein VF303_01350 [Candidatus Nanoarchaeia archaeon]
MAKAVKTTTRRAAPKKPTIGGVADFFSAWRKDFLKRWGQKPIAYSVSLLILIIAIAFASLFVFNKSLFIAGTIDGRWVTSWQFYSKLTKASGEDVFDSIVREVLIKREAAKKNISASEKGVDKKIKELEEQFGGKENFDLALKQNKTSIEELRGQIAIQILAEKLLEDKIEVADAEVDKYIKENKEATKDLSKEQVKDQLRSQKLSQEFTPWFEELKNKANITTYF